MGLVPILLKKYFDDIIAPLSVEVKTRHIASRHTMDHSIRIHHWDYHKFKLVKQKLAYLI